MEADQLSQLSVKELKQILRERNVDSSDCIEKSDLIKKINETKDLEKKKPRIKEEKIADFDCNVIEPSQGPIDQVVILLYV